jgi:hypothetical protein
LATTIFFAAYFDRFTSRFSLSFLILCLRSFLRLILLKSGSKGQNKMKGAEEQSSHGVASRGIHQTFDHGDLFSFVLMFDYI